MASDATNAELVRGFFAREGWTFSSDDDPPVAVRTVVEAAGTRWPLIVAVTEDERIVVYSVLPADLADGARPVMVELVARINAGMLLGNFELDEQGLVRFKTSAGVAGVELTDSVLRELVYPNVVTMESYLPLVTDVAGGEVDLEAAVERLATLEAAGDP